VSGAHGVGKTTLCFDLQSALEAQKERPPSVCVLTDVARTLRTEGIRINRETEDSQYALFFEKHVCNLLADHSADYIIYDRTVLDSIAYAAVNGNLHEHWIRFMKSLSSLIMKKIDLYFFVPIEFPLRGDGIRDTEIEYQRHLDQALAEFVRQCRPEFQLITGTRSERLRLALDLIHPLQ